LTKSIFVVILVVERFTTEREKSEMTKLREKFEAEIDSHKTKYGTIDLRKSNGLSNSEKKFLALASKMAETSDVDNKHGAVVVKGGRVLQLGVNKWTNKGLIQEEDNWLPILTVHAEIDALSRIDDAQGAVLYIARAPRSEKGSTYSRPCHRCMEAIRAAGIKRIIYTVN
jgi:deoxycytidylate deaminase